MVKIKNGDKVMTVTRGAYNSIFKDMGFIMVHEAKTPKTFDEDAEEDTEGAEMEEETQLEEKPLSEMNFNELKEYASQLGIPTAGMRTRKELKEAIQQAEQ